VRYVRKERGALKIHWGSKLRQGGELGCSRVGKENERENLEKNKRQEMDVGTRVVDL
jgi:hypothetical protein